MSEELPIFLVSTGEDCPACHAFTNRAIDEHNNEQPSVLDSIERYLAKNLSSRVLYGRVHKQHFLTDPIVVMKVYKLAIEEETGNVIAEDQKTCYANAYFNNLIHFYPNMIIIPSGSNPLYETSNDIDSDLIDWPKIEGHSIFAGDPITGDIIQPTPPMNYTTITKWLTDTVNSMSSRRGSGHDLRGSRSRHSPKANSERVMRFGGFYDDESSSDDDF